MEDNCGMTQNKILAIWLRHRAKYALGVSYSLNATSVVQNKQPATCIHECRTQEVTSLCYFSAPSAVYRAFLGAGERYTIYLLPTNGMRQM